MKLKQLYYDGVGIAPLKLLTAISPVTSLFPYHHVVSDYEIPHISSLYSFKDSRQFTKDLEYFLKNFKPISACELLKYILNHQQLPEKKFLLSFDDGFREVKDIIAPILSHYGLPAIFFVNPAFIDNRAMFYRNKVALTLYHLKKQDSSSTVLDAIRRELSVQSSDQDAIREALLKLRIGDEDKLEKIADLLNFSFQEYLETEQPWLTLDDLYDLSAQGFEIGGHSWDHPYYNEISADEQLRQTLSSMEFCDQFRNKISSFSFPHSDAALGQSFFSKILGSGKIDLLFGIQNQKAELNNRMIHRFNCERPSIPIEKQVKGMLAYSSVQRLTQQQNIKRN